MSQPTRRRRLAVVALYALAALSGTGAVAAPAGAAPPGPQYVHSSSPEDTDAAKSWLVPCPRGTVAISGGAFLGGDTAAVHIDTLRPVLDGQFFEAAAAAVPSRRQGPWGLHVYAICVEPPPGLVYLPAVWSPSYDSPLRTALAICPAGRQLLGFGGRAAVESGRNVALTAMFPAANLSRVVVQSYALEGGETEDWTAEAYAVCADPVPGMHVVQLTVGPDSVDNKYAAASCGVGHLRAIGAAIFAGGQAWYRALYPQADLSAGIVLPGADPTGMAGNWWVNASAICA